jgi:hypothetical protein
MDRERGSITLMRLMNRFLAAAGLLACALVSATAMADAQETPGPSTATPAPASSPTLMDIQYDGRTHVMLAPYIWGPTVRGNYQYSIPTLPGRPGGVVQSSVQVKPVDYAGSLNSAAMFAFDARKGDIDVFGDYIYTNASASASASATISGRFGKVQIPVSLNTNARLAVSIWEAAAGFTVARGHDADLSIFMGLREFPLNLTLDYNATIGKRGIITKSGTVKTSDITQDVIFGLRGKAFFGDSRWFVPYYMDVGSGAGTIGNQTWEAYSGAGYAFNHGQTLLFAYRTLNYNSFAPISHVQKLSMAGPLLGYTFNL